jgi:glucose-1-phosphate thymidylyltransferase
VQASEFVRVVQSRQGLKIGCPEEIAWRSGWIDDAALESRATEMHNSGYGNYLLSLIAERSV